MLLPILSALIWACQAYNVDSQVPFNIAKDFLPVPNATRSFWIHSALDANPLAHEGSSGKLTTGADVCIIGSGMTGVSAAYHLSTASIPLKAVILEAREFCMSSSGATGRNGGHLTPHFFLGFRSRQSQHGKAEAIRSYLLEHYTVNSILSFIHLHNLSESVDLTHGGHFKLFFTDSEESDARADYESAIEAGWIPDTSLTWLNRQQMNKTYGAPHPGYQTTFGYNFWPLKFVTQLYKHASTSSSLDLSLHTHTPVLSMERSSQPERRWSLNTPRGTVSCTTVLHATNAYTPHLLPNLSSFVVPTRGQVITVEMAVNSSEGAILPEVGSWTANDGYEYWFPRNKSTSESTTIILGGGREASNGEQNLIDDSVVNLSVGDALRAFLPRVFSSIKMEVNVMMEWTGIMGYTRSGSSLVGKIADGQFISVGYNGHGMPRAYGCAEAAAGMIAAEFRRESWGLPSWFPKHYLI